MELIPDKRKLVGLVEQAHEGKLCIPNFQRDFVWRREEVADLVRSIVRGYYIGSLLLLRSDPSHPPFAPQFLRGAKPSRSQAHPELLVLDGQQRLTALLYALTAPDLTLKDSSQRRWFFIDLAKLLEDPSDDEVVFHRSSRDLEDLDQPGRQYERQILPCTLLMPNGSFLNWRDGYDDWLREKDPVLHRRFRQEWRKPWTDAVAEFQSFEVPLVELPRVEERDGQALGRVCAIFEKLNSTGVELSVYDLLTARLYRSGIKLHDLWTAACKANKRLNEWSAGKADKHNFGVLVLRALALLRGLDPKPRFLIDLDPEGFERDWVRASAAVERGLELLASVGPDGFGVFNSKWLPGFGLLPVLGALRLEIEERQLGDQARADLRRWYWCSVFLERYSSAVETKSRRDYAELTARWTGESKEPVVFTDAAAQISSLGYSVRDSASHASSVYCGIFCLLALQSARDWGRVEDITLQSLEDHHIFPKSYLREHGITERSRVNSVVNRTLISDKTNGRIKASAPAKYQLDPRVFPAGPDAALMGPHFIDAEGLAAMQRAEERSANEVVAKAYADFCAARERAIVSKIRLVCGIAPPNGEQLRESVPAAIPVTGKP